MPAVPGWSWDAEKKYIAAVTMVHSERGTHRHPSGFHHHDPSPIWVKRSRFSRSTLNLRNQETEAAANC